MANITSYNASLRTVQDFGIDIAREQVVGVKPFKAFGELIITNGVSKWIIWPASVFTIPPSTGIDGHIVSSSNNDTDGGSGVNVIEVHYLDFELKEQSKLITLTGTTPILNVIPDFRFINDMHVHVTGTLGQGATGTIKVYRDFDTYNFIPVGENCSLSSVRMVSKGKRGIVAGFIASSISGTAAARSLIQIVATELNGHQYTDQNLWIPFGSVGVQDNSETFIFPVPFSFKEGTAIAMLLKNTDKGVTVTGSWFGWLEDQ